ncbi:MAG: MFS transporter [Bdellovibrionales bacterium]
MEKKNSKSALIVIFVIVFMDLVGFGMIIPLSTYLGKHLGATAMEIGLLMSIYSLMQFVFSPFWGKLSDKFGRRPILLLSLFGSSTSYLLFAYSDSLWLLFLSRGLAGFFGANISTAMAYIADVTPADARSKSMGLIGAAFGMGFILGPVLGGLFGDLGVKISDQPPFGMNFAALIAAGICYLNFFVALKVLKESLTKEVRAKLKPRTSRWAAIKNIFGRPVLPGLLLITLFQVFAMAQMEATVFLYIDEVFQWPLRIAYFGFAYIGVVMVLTQGYFIRKWMPKYGEKNLLFLGLGLAAIGMVGIAFVDNIWTMAITQTFLALGVGMINPSLLGSVSLLSDETEQGMIMGVNQSMSALGRIIGPALGGFIYSINIQSPYFLGGFMMLAGMIILFSISKNLKSRGKTA